MGQRSFAAAALMAACLAAPGPLAAAEIIDRVLAMVGTQVVTLSDLRAAETFGLVPPAAKAGGAVDVLAGLVNRQLMLDEVERYSAPEPDPLLLDRRLAEMKAGFPSESEYAQALLRTAMSEGRLRSVVADNLRLEAYVDQRFSGAVQPTADEVQQYYREHPGEFTTGGRLAAFEDVQPIVLAKVSAERRRALLADWLDRLRRRGFVSALSGGAGR
jgi:hypothetical protein